MVKELGGCSLLRNELDRGLIALFVILRIFVHGEVVGFLSFFVVLRLECAVER